MTYGPARSRYERRKRLRQRRLANAGFWNILTGVFIFATILLGVWFLWLLFFQNKVTGSKNSQGNSFIFASVGKPGSSTPEGIVTKIPKTQTQLAPDNSNLEGTQQPTLNNDIDPTFDLQAEPQSISASLFRADRNCSWLGVAGQVFDLQGRPVPGITVQVIGPLYGKDIRLISMTGSAPWYGAGGFEIFLGDQLFDSSNGFEIRLIDQNGRGLSPRISFSTSNECEKNLVIINFHQVK